MRGLMSRWWGWVYGWGFEKVSKLKSGSKWIEPSSSSSSFSSFFRVAKTTTRMNTKKIRWVQLRRGLLKKKDRMLIISHWKKTFGRLGFPWFLPVFSEPWNRSEKGGKELVPPFCLYACKIRMTKFELLSDFDLLIYFLWANSFFDNSWGNSLVWFHQACAGGSRREYGRAQ